VGDASRCGGARGKGRVAKRLVPLGKSKRRSGSGVNRGRVLMPWTELPTILASTQMRDVERGYLGIPLIDLRVTQCDLWSRN